MAVIERVQREKLMPEKLREMVVVFEEEEKWVKLLVQQHQ